MKVAATRLLAEDTRFRAAVRESVAQADRDEFIEERKEWNAACSRILGSLKSVPAGFPPLICREASAPLSFRSANRRAMRKRSANCTSVFQQADLDQK